MASSPDVTAPPYRIDDATPPAAREAGLNALARAAASDPLIRQAAAVVRAHPAPGYGAGWQALAASALALVQRLPYVDDAPGQEWWQGPVYTLAHGGDCEDLAALYAAVMLAAGVPARVFWLDLPGETSNHVTALVGPQGGELWAETILPGARLGEHPLDAAKRLGGVSRARLLGAAPGPVRGGPDARVRPSGALDGSQGWILLQPADAAWVQWADLPRADAWFQEAARRFAAFDTLDALPYAQQRSAVLDAFRALGYGYRALDLPPVIDPVFRVATLAAFGQMRGPDFATAAAQKFRPVDSIGAQRTPNGNVPREVFVRLVEGWRLLGKNTGDLGNHAVSIPVRAWLDGDGNVADNCTANPFSDEATGDCAYKPGAFQYMGCALDGATVEGCGDDAHPYNWHVWNWHDPPQGLAAAPPAWRMLAPLAWFYRWGADVAAACAQRGASEVLTQARGFQIATNVRTALENNLVSAGTPDAAALYAAAQALPQNLAAAAWNSPQMRDAGQRLASLGRTLGTVNPAFGSALQLAGAVTSVLPSAVGVQTDDFDRAIPVYERPWIAGTVATPPQWSVPDPPAAPAPDTSHTVTLGGDVGVNRYLSRTLAKYGNNLGPDVAGTNAAPAPAPDAGLSTGAKAALGLGAVVAAAAVALKFSSR